MIVFVYFIVVLLYGATESRQGASLYTNDYHRLIGTPLGTRHSPNMCYRTLPNLVTLNQRIWGPVKIQSTGPAPLG